MTQGGPLSEETMLKNISRGKSTVAGQARKALHKVEQGVSGRRGTKAQAASAALGIGQQTTAQMSQVSDKYQTQRKEGILKVHGKAAEAITADVQVRKQKEIADEAYERQIKQEKEMLAMQQAAQKKAAMKSLVVGAVSAVAGGFLGPVVGGLMGGIGSALGTPGAAQGGFGAGFKKGFAGPQMPELPKFGAGDTADMIRAKAMQSQSMMMEHQYEQSNNPWASANFWKRFEGGSGIFSGFFDAF